jgi:hypothetical protein
MIVNKFKALKAVEAARTRLIKFVLSEKEEFINKLLLHPRKYFFFFNGAPYTKAQAGEKWYTSDKFLAAMQMYTEEVYLDFSEYKLLRTFLEA